VSSTSIKVASVTVSAINQGLCLGCHPSTEEWCTRWETGFCCGATVAVTNAYPGEWFFLIVRSFSQSGTVHRSRRPGISRLFFSVTKQKCHPERSRGICGAPLGLPEFSVSNPNTKTAQSTCCLALYPSRAMMSYFNGWCFSSCIFSGWPSLSTSSTRILR
jgi:hypothetical protein